MIYASYFLFYRELKLVIRFRTPCLVLGLRRKAEKRRIGPDLHRMSVGQEFEQTQPAVSPVSTHAATQRLAVEHHLVHIVSGCILVGTESRGIVQPFIRSGIVSAQHKTDVGGRLHQLLPDAFARIGRGYLIAFFGDALAVEAGKIGMGDENHCVVFEAWGSHQFPCP